MYSSTLSGQLIMDFDYSHFAVLKVALLPGGRPAERPAPLIVSVFGPNWTKWERLLAKFAVLCLHADSPERRSLADLLKNSCSAHKHTSTGSQITLSFCSHIDEVLNFFGACMHSQLRLTTLQGMHPVSELCPDPHHIFTASHPSFCASWYEHLLQLQRHCLIVVYNSACWSPCSPLQSLKSAGSPCSASTAGTTGGLSCSPPDTAWRCSTSRLGPWPSWHIPVMFPLAGPLAAAVLRQGMAAGCCGAGYCRDCSVPQVAPGIRARPGEASLLHVGGNSSPKPALQVTEGLPEPFDCSAVGPMPGAVLQDGENFIRVICSQP